MDDQKKLENEKWINAEKINREIEEEVKKIQFDIDEIEKRRERIHQKRILAHLDVDKNNMIV